MKAIYSYQKRLWAEVDLDNLRHNFLQIDNPVCCVIKANAYGHGASLIGPFFETIGAKYLAVSNIEEGIQLRNSGVKIPILILGYTPAECVEELSKYNLDQTVYSFEYSRNLNKYAVDANVNINIHIKIDTGMGRIGFQFFKGVNELPLALAACKNSNLNPVGIFTHFCCSDEGKNTFTIEQFSFFKKAVEYLEKNGASFSLKHCSNSAAIIDYPDYGLDMVRAGILLYGVNPTNNRSISLKPVLSLWSVVSNIKKVRKGDSISYGRSFVADKDMMVATIPIGYADGFWRSNQGHHVYINGERCEIIGRVCMDQIMVRCNNANIGDLVEVYGKNVPIEEVAEYNHTIPYEILCSIGERVPRVYIKDGKIVEIVDKLV